MNTSGISFSPCSFSPSTAKQLLTSHGWKVVPGGTTTCQNPSLCGTGISKGEGISFNIDYLSGVVATQNEMNDLASQAKKLGMTINLTTHPFSTVISLGAPCPATKASCKWSAENWGAGWIYGPSYLPTGEPLYNPGSAANAGSYQDTQMTNLITKTITGPVSQESNALATYASYAGAARSGDLRTDLGRYVHRRCRHAGQQEAGRLRGQRAGLPGAAVLVLHEVDCRLK